MTAVTDLKKMNSEGCVVRGTLALVLKVCRIFGMAPLRFEKLKDGYKATVSYYYTIYSCILVTCLNIFPIMSLSMDLHKRAVKAKTLSNLAFVLPDLLTAYVSSGFGGYYGFHRMKKMIMFINRLDEAKANINDTTIIKKRVNMKSVAFIIYAAIILAFYIMETRNLIMNYGSETFIVINYSLCTIAYINMNLLEVQMVLLLLEARTTIKSINNKMDEMISLISTENQYLRRVKCPNIQPLAYGYVIVCDTISDMSSTDGCIVHLIFTNFVITLINTLYYGMTLMSELPILYILLQNLWCVLCFFVVLAFVEACNSITTQVKKLKMNLPLLMEKMTNIGDRLPWELELMFKQLKLNKPSYSPLEIFTPQRSTITTIISAVITYLLFMMQLKL